ncbi:MAG: hypothetical protein ACI396_07405 [Acutalibacteraceae bacterium]
MIKRTKLFLVIEIIVLLSICLCSCGISEEAQAVIDNISSIGNIDCESENKIKDVENEYNKLTDEQKKEVSNYEQLKEKRSEFEKIKQDSIAAYKTIVKQTEADDIDKAIENYKSLNSLSLELGRNEILNSLIKRVDNSWKNKIPLSSNGKKSTSPVDKNIINKFKKYQSFAELLNVSDSDSTNIKSFISKVLSFEKYIKYDDVLQFFDETNDNQSNISLYSDLLVEYSLDYLTGNQYVKKIANEYETIYNIANDYPQSSYGIKEVAAANKNLMNTYQGLYNGKLYELDSDIEKAYKEVSDNVKEQLKQMQKDIVNMPTLY